MKTDEEIVRWIETELEPAKDGGNQATSHQITDLPGEADQYSIHVSVDEGRHIETFGPEKVGSNIDCLYIQGQYSGKNGLGIVSSGDCDSFATASAHSQSESRAGGRDATTSGNRS